MPLQRRAAARELNHAQGEVGLALNCVFNVLGIPRSRRKNVATKGLHFSLTPSNPHLRRCIASVDASKPNDLPQIDISTIFSNPNDAPILSTIVNVDRHRFFVMGYMDAQLQPNTSVHDIFPHLPWHGEIIVFSLGRRVSILSRLASPRYIAQKAISVYIRAVMEAKMCNRQLAPQVTFMSQSVFLV